jgi:hypothetical protein
MPARRRCKPLRHVLVSCPHPHYCDSAFWPPRVPERALTHQQSFTGAAAGDPVH